MQYIHGDKGEIKYSRIKLFFFFYCLDPLCAPFVENCQLRTLPILGRHLTNISNRFYGSFGSFDSIICRSLIFPVFLPVQKVKHRRFLWISSQNTFRFLTQKKIKNQWIFESSVHFANHAQFRGMRIMEMTETAAYTCRVLKRTHRYRTPTSCSPIPDCCQQTNDIVYTFSRGKTRYWDICAHKHNA